MWSAYYETASWVDVVFYVLLVKLFFCQNRFDNLGDNCILDLVVGYVVIVLMGYNHCIDTLWCIVLIFDSHLAFCIGPEPFDGTAFPKLCGFKQNLMGQHYRRRHKGCCLVAGKAEHKTLVSGTLFSFIKSCS